MNNIKKVTLFPGDGIGPEITNSVKNILHAIEAPIEFEEFLLGAESYKQTNELIPLAAINSIKKNKVALKAPVTTPIGHGFRSVNVQLRLLLDLYANIRPCKNLPYIPCKYENVDLIIFRENTEDLYIGEEQVISDNEVIALKRITRFASERIIRKAFEYAKNNNLTKVTCVHKANILKKSDGLFLSIFNELKQEYPSIEANDLIVDNACMQLVMHPEKYSVLVMPNLYGDILSDLSSGLIGGLGIMPGINQNDEYAVFEAVHGSAPDIAKQNIANPTALLLSCCYMLDHLQLKEYSDKIRQAINDTLKDQKNHTKDLGGNATLSEYTEQIITNLLKK